MNYLFRDAARDWLALSKLGASGFADRANRLLALYPYEVSLRMYDPLDSHDTPRFITLCGGDIGKYRLAVALQMCFPGCPAVYYGDELGMEGEMTRVAAAPWTGRQLRGSLNCLAGSKSS